MRPEFSSLSKNMSLLEQRVFQINTVNLIHDLITLTVFIWKTRCSSKLIFLDKDENSGRIHKIESEDDLDNEIFFCGPTEANVLCEKRRTWGNLGSLARTSTIEITDNGAKFNLPKVKVESQSSLKVDELKSGKGSGHDGYLSQTEGSNSMNDSSSSSDSNPLRG